MNYAPYLPVYYPDMVNLPDKHPGLHRYFQQGGFAVQLINESPFASIPVDQVVEETVNKDIQIAGGAKGFSLKPSSVQKDYMISEFHTSFMGNPQGYVRYSWPELCSS